MTLQLHGIHIALLDKTRVHVWKPHLHEIASGTLDIDVDSVEYFAHARARHYRFRVGAMCGLDREKRRVFVEPTLDADGRQLIPPRVLGYDTQIVAVGSVGNDFATPGVKQHAIAIDSAAEAARFNRRMINACVRANAQYEPLHEGQLHCVIIGAGATSVELVAELHKTMRDIAAYGLDNIDFDELIRLTIIEAGPRILGLLSPGEGRPAPPCAQTAHQMASLVERAVSARLMKKALPKFEYRDFGNLVNLSEYRTVDNLVGLVGKRSVYLDGFFARLMYRSLYKMHQRALHGTLKTALDAAANLISRRTGSRVKLHCNSVAETPGEPNERSNRSDCTIGQERKDCHRARSRTADTHR